MGKARTPGFRAFAFHGSRIALRGFRDDSLGYRVGRGTSLE